MREKYIFFIGLGTGLVLTAIISLFLYNTLRDNNKDVNIEPYSTTREIVIEDTSDQVISTTALQEAIQTTTISMKISTSKPMEITTSKPFEISTN